MTGKAGFHFFSDAESRFSYQPLTAAGMGTAVIPMVVELFTDERNYLPFHVRTGQQAMGDVAERKKFRYVEFHGCGQDAGTVRVKVYIDGRYVCDGMASLGETPDKRRKINIPIGRQHGYTIDVEFCGSATPRSVEFTFETMNSQS